MITPDYVQMMARYNGWQNDNVIAACRTLDTAALSLDRGAFFGSILGTLNHLLWGDLLWMSRFDGGRAPDLAQADSATLHPTFDSWCAQRIRTDGRIRLWAQYIRPAQLRGELAWQSTTGQDKSRPLGECVVHFFNHQTHHRGQVHAMLTAAGAKTQPTDLTLVPVP